MKEKNKNQGGKLKWSKKVQIKFVINLSVPDIPSAHGQEAGGAALSTRLQGRGWISAVCGGAVGVSIFMTHSTKIFVFI